MPWAQRLLLVLGGMQCGGSGLHCGGVNSLGSRPESGRVGRRRSKALALHSHCHLRSWAPLTHHISGLVMAIPFLVSLLYSPTGISWAPLPNKLVFTPSARATTPPRGSSSDLKSSSWENLRHGGWPYNSSTHWATFLEWMWPLLIIDPCPGRRQLGWSWGCQDIWISFRSIFGSESSLLLLHFDQLLLLTVVSTLLTETCCGSSNFPHGTLCFQRPK